MRVSSTRTVGWICLAALIAATAGCGSSNLLREYEFEDRDAAALMAFPPAPEVSTHTFMGLDAKDPIRSAIRIGTTIVKEVEAHRAEARLDSAMVGVDVPERIRVRTLERCSQYLRYRPVEDTKDAEFLFDMRIRQYGIDASSWGASVHFKMDIEVQLLDSRGGVRIWKTRVKEGIPVTEGIFGLGGSTGDVVTAVVLAKLSVEELTRGFEHLADFTADRVARKLQEDFAKARLEGRG